MLWRLFLIAAPACPAEMTSADALDCLDGLRGRAVMVVVVYVEDARADLALLACMWEAEAVTVPSRAFVLSPVLWR